MTALRAPIPARAPWLTAVLNARAAQPASRRWRSRPVAVVVDGTSSGPAAAAFLSLHRQGPVTVISMLGAAAAPLPIGRPTARLLAADPAAARLLADGILDLLTSQRRPWSLRLSGLPLGCPTTAALAARVETAAFSSARTTRLVDALDAAVGPVHRSRNPRDLDRALPDLLERLPDDRSRAFLRTTARVHAAIGQVELAWAGDLRSPGAALLTLVDGNDRWPWWGFCPDGGVPTEMGAPLVSLTATGGPRPRLELPWTSVPRRPWGHRGERVRGGAG